MHSAPCSFFRVATIFGALHLAKALVVNRTIDDHYGDSVTGRLPVYSGEWDYGPTCPECSVQPSLQDVFMSSWHETTSSSQYAHDTVTLLFNGKDIGCV